MFGSEYRLKRLPLCVAATAQPKTLGQPLVRGLEPDGFEVEQSEEEARIVREETRQPGRIARPRELVSESSSAIEAEDILPDELSHRSRGFGELPQCRAANSAAAPTLNTYPQRVNNINVVQHVSRPFLSPGLVSSTSTGVP
jgi:hypothetical protein